MSYATVRFGRGSSPHVRGAPFQGAGRNNGVGIIPACAGSTGRLVLRSTFQKGSSPHVRGAPDHRA